MIALDTNVVSEIAKDEPAEVVVNWLATFAQNEIFLPAVVVAELLAGLELMPFGKRRDALVGLVLAYISSISPENIVNFGYREAEHYARILAARKKLGRPISIADAQVAASAAARNLPVATRNVRDFEHCGVKVVNPWEHQ